jgi:CheY-like chemotaxis protein
MIVDDDPDVRGFVADTLAGLGHEVAACESGAAALAALDAAAPELVLIDFTMPGMNGAELARELRARRPDLPLAFVTGYAETEQIEDGAGGNVPVLRKPFGIGELAALVGALAGSAPPDRA